MNLDFIAGLIDADGSLSLSLEKASENRFGYRRRLVLNITNQDRALLNLVKDFLGFGRVEDTDIEFIYAFRTNSHQDAKKIIYLFESRLHGPAKKQMPVWKEAFNLCSDRSKPSYVEFVHLMYSIYSLGVLRRNPISYWLDIFDSSHETKRRIKTFKGVASLAMNSSYVSGYTQGDGSFYLSQGKRFTTNWSLTDGDRSILDKIQRFLLPGTSCVFDFFPKTSPKNKMCHRLLINRFDKCRTVIVPHFDNFPVLGMQRKRYLLWREAVFLASEGTIESKARISEICDLLRIRERKERRGVS